MNKVVLQPQTHIHILSHTQQRLDSIFFSFLPFLLSFCLQGEMSDDAIFDIGQMEYRRKQRISELNSTFQNEGEIPISEDEQKIVDQLDFFKRWYLLCHVAYMMAIVITGVVLFLLLQGHSLSFIDALFVSMSTVCNCGLQTVNVAEWSSVSHVTRHILMVLGGVVFTSMYQPLLRLYMIERVRSVFEPHQGDSATEGRLRAMKKIYAERLRAASIVSALVTISYFLVVNSLAILLLFLLNASNLGFRQTVSVVLTSFHGCVFSSLEAFSGDPCVVTVVSLCCALGFTAFPVVLRFYFRVSKAVVTLCFRVRGRFCALDGSENSESEVSLLEHARPCVRKNSWITAFDDILGSQHPGNFHSFLFLSPECVFLGIAWTLLTVLQAAPFWFQQWHGILGGYSATYKVFLSFGQAASVRFAAANFVSLHSYSNAHIAVTILAMYLPALPISTDRTYRKWKEMFRTSIFRLLTSRLFWLFTALLCIIFEEEVSMYDEIKNTRFDIMTRVFFEVISAYSGCGLSLSLQGSNLSFVGSASSLTKFIIVLVLFGGRHRFIDLGIDLGLHTLQTEVRLQQGG